MIEQQGRIVRAEEGRAWVAIGPQGGCSACDAGQGCGAGLFGRLLRRGPATLRVINTQELRVGQAVVLGIPELFFLRLVLRLYAWPLLGGLAGALICHQVSGAFGWNRGVTDLLTLIGLVGCAWLVMPGRRAAHSAVVIEEHIGMYAAAGASNCSAARPEPRH
jgi:sigma-E factor negative regulatory protein RseC